MPTQRRPPRSGGRVAYADASSAGRAVLFAANGAGLSVREHRTLNAVIAFTALYSRTEDRRLYLAQLAAFSFGVIEALPWMVNKTREDLAALDKAGLIVRTPPKGRPMKDDGPRYHVALRAMESHPDSGVTFGEKRHPELANNAPRSGEQVTPILSESHPDLGASNPGKSPRSEGAYREDHSEEDREGPSEEVVRAIPLNRAGAVDWLAGRLAAPTTIDPTAANRAARLILDHFPAHAVRDVVAELPLDNVDDAEPWTAGDFLDAIIGALEDDHEDAAEEISSDPRYYALAIDDHLVATRIASAGPDGWDAHIDEAVQVARHWREHELPIDIIGDTLARIEHDGIKRPGHADRIARQIADHMVDWPTLRLGPAQPATKRATA